MSAHDLNVACAATLVVCIIVVALCIRAIWREDKRLKAIEDRLRSDRERRQRLRCAAQHPAAHS